MDRETLENQEPTGNSLWSQKGYKKTEIHYEKIKPSRENTAKKTVSDCWADGHL